MTAVWLCALGALTRPAAAIELSLEENRAQRGNIGYIDMRRLFKAYPETVRAKENFEELVRQAEDQVNLRRVEILRLRNDLSRLKVEREFLSKTPLVISTAPAAPAPARASTSAASSPLPGFAAPVDHAAVSTGAAAETPQPLIINIPGVSTAPIVVAPPSAAGPLGPAPAAQAAIEALADIDAQISSKIGELALKEDQFKVYQAGAEKNLLDLESRRTEILLGRIHRAVQEVARQEGVSVVVDKGSILYGHSAVDLTEKVLKHLKGS